jgi:hypothetical protein
MEAAQGEIRNAALVYLHGCSLPMLFIVGKDDAESCAASRSPSAALCA